MIEMQESEILDFAIKGIDSEIDKKEKSLRRGLLLIQAHNKGVQKSDLSLAELNDRVKKVRAEIESLCEKKAYLQVQTEEWD